MANPLSYSTPQTGVTMFLDPATHRAHLAYLAANEEDAAEEAQTDELACEAMDMYLDDTDHQIHRSDDDPADLPAASEWFDQCQR